MKFLASMVVLGAILAFSYAQTTDTPTNNHFKVTRSDGVVCLVADMGVRFSIDYLNTAEANKTVVVALPSVNQTAGGVTGMCEEDSNTLMIAFSANWRLMLAFGKDGDSFALENVTLTYDTSVAPFENAKNPGVQDTTGTNLGLLQCAVGRSLLCKENVDAVLGTATMTFTYVQVQAFSTAKTDAFAYADHCDTDTSELVPIVVGCVLAAFVLIILAVYFIRKRRAKPDVQSD